MARVLVGVARVLVGAARVIVSAARVPVGVARVQMGKGNGASGRSKGATRRLTNQALSLASLLVCVGANKRDSGLVSAVWARADADRVPRLRIPWGGQATAPPNSLPSTYVCAAPHGV